MEDDKRWREGTIGRTPVALERRADGSILAASREPLGTHRARVTDALVHWAQVAPTRSFMAARDQDGAWVHVTYADMLARARRVGSALLARGMSAERPVVILSDNDLEHATLALACMHVGIPYAPVSAAYSLLSTDFAKLRHIVGLLTPGLVYVADAARFAPALQAVLPAGTEVVSARPGTHGATPFHALLDTPAAAAADTAHAALGPDDIAKFLFTSGSTKAPKAVINTHRMMTSNQQVLRQVMPFLADEPPVLLDWLPWSHTFGGNHNVGLVLENGGTLYIDDGRPVPGEPFARSLRNLREVAPTVWFNVPRGYEMLAEALPHDAALRRNFFSRLQLMFSAGAAFPVPVARAIHAQALAECGERVGIHTGLGMTETAPWALGMVRVDEVQGGVGTPAPGVTVKLVPNLGKLELRYRGPGVTPGYWRQPELAAEAFDEEGYFRSGDALAFVDEARPDLGFRFDGRVAEDFKLVTGTWVSVGPLRAAALAAGSPLLQDVVVTGHDRGEVGLLAFARPDACRALAGLPAAATTEDVLAAPAVTDFFQHLLDTLHAAGTGSATRPARLRLQTVPPSIDRGEQTDKGSLNQRAVLALRTDEVDALYAGAPGTLVARKA